MSECDHCPCVSRVILAVENGGLEGVVQGALKGIAKEHPAVRYSASISRRIRGQIKGRIRELFGVAARQRYDPWKKHCPTCACELEVVQRTQRAARPEGE